MIFAQHNVHESDAAAQIQAFDDTWHWTPETNTLYTQAISGGVPARVADALTAMRTLLGENDAMAYLVGMAPRLVELHRVLKPTGSLYLHCDPTMSHYLKVMLDAIFGPGRFRNEIVWKRTTAHSSAKRYAPIHDVLLYYSKTPVPIWNGPREDYEQEYLDRYYRFDDGDGRLYWRADITGAGTRKGATGQPWRGINPTAMGRHWMIPPDELDKLDAEGRIYWPAKGTMPQHKRYREDLKGRAASDIWTDIDRINPVGDERLGYQTQKPRRCLSGSSRRAAIRAMWCSTRSAVAVPPSLSRSALGGAGSA